MKTMCGLAKPEIEYSGLGNHCFRVYAMNMAVKLGASPMTHDSGRAGAVAVRLLPAVWKRSY